MNDLWADADVAEIIRLWNAGNSASEIAAVIPGERTRNSVIGKIHRLRQAGVVFERAPMEPKERTARAVQSRMARERRTRLPKPPRPKKQRRHNNLAGFNTARRSKSQERPMEPLAPVLVEVTQARPWLERALGECAYPVSGEGADTLSCCNPTDATYCAGHAAIMFVTPKEPPSRLIKWGVRFAA